MTQAVNGFVRTNGGDVAMMTMAQLQAYAGQVAAYRKQCDTAQGK